MSLDIEKLRSIGVPGRKRGSHVYSSGGSAKTAVDRVRDYATKHPFATKQELERQARIEACGAPSDRKFAEALTAGFQEVGKVIDEKANLATWTESPLTPSTTE